ncbi:MAG: tetratricopeptide repeat protein [Bacteroidales bacterium]|nr:tetratricopeptide repeat protein [Bacteroidales bacterium]
MDKINYSLFIEKYLDGEMNETELKWFEKELEGNPQLQKELKLREEVNLAIAESDIMELRDELNTIYKDQYPERIPSRKIQNLRKIIIPIAASLIIAFITFAVKPFNRDYTNQELVARYYTPYDAGMNYRSAATEEENLLKAAYENYREKRFEHAIKYFEAALQKDENNMASHFYTGMSYFELKKYNPAETNFETVITNRENLYLDQAEWYLGLCYLASNNREKALVIFRKISQSDSFYARKAKKLSRKMT